MIENEIKIDDIVQYMDDLKKAKAELSFNLKQVEKEIKKNELILESFLNKLDVNEVVHGVYTFGWKYTTRTVFDQERFKKENPKLYEEFKTEKEYKSFDFKVNS